MATGNSNSWAQEGGAAIKQLSGQIANFGIDLGYRKRGVITGGVLTHTSSSKIDPLALAGSYSGLKSERELAPGLQGWIPVGGFRGTIALQPLAVAVAGIKGPNLAAGISRLKLRNKN